MVTGVHERTVFPGIEEPWGKWWSVFHGWKGSQVEQVSAISHCNKLRKCEFVV